jgi:hypothetical protein
MTRWIKRIVAVAALWLVMIPIASSMAALLGLLSERINDLTPRPLFPWWPDFLVVSPHDAFLAPMTVPLLCATVAGLTVLFVLRMTYLIFRAGSGARSAASLS